MDGASYFSLKFIQKRAKFEISQFNSYKNVLMTNNQKSLITNGLFLFIFFKLIFHFEYTKNYIMQ